MFNNTSNENVDGYLYFKKKRNIPEIFNNLI